MPLHHKITKISNQTQLTQAYSQSMLLLDKDVTRENSQTPFSFKYNYHMVKKISRIGKIPAFLKKLLSMLDDINFTEYIGWLQEENGFHIINVAKFTEEVLPKYFKHQNMASFVRQLNMYGFNRTKNSEQHVYFHSKFKKDQINLIKCIKRKKLHRKEDRKLNQASSCQDGDEIIADSNLSSEDWHQKYEQAIRENQMLHRENQCLSMKLQELEFLKIGINNFVDTVSGQRKYEKKGEQILNTSESSQKSEEKLPKINQQEIKIKGSSFGFFGSLQKSQQRQCYQKLIKSQYHTGHNDFK